MRGSGPRTRVWIGLVLVILGALFLLDNLTDWHFPRETLWPVLLIAFGVMNLVRRGSARWLGAVLTLLGIVFLLDALDIVTFHMRDIWRLWPLVLLVIGVRMMLGVRKRRPRRPKRREATPGPGSDRLDASYIFGSGTQRVTGQSFSEGSATAVFGSAQIDLRYASLAGGEATIDVTVLFGSIELRVPESWEVDVQAAPILGGVEDKRIRPARADGREQVTITGICMFGSIVIES